MTGKSCFLSAVIENRGKNKIDFKNAELYRLILALLF